MMSKHIIDSHAHIFPEKIAQKASDGIGAFYSLDMNYNGTVSALLSEGEKSGMDGYVVQSVATTVHQVENINNFIYETVSDYPDKLFGFATLHPDMPNPCDEVDRVISLGFKGIKLHPDFQHFSINGASACRLFDAINGRLPVLVHTGDSRYSFSNPRLMADAAEKYPAARFIAAHFGGWSEWEDAEKYLCKKKNVWVDTSSSFYAMSEEEAVRLILKFGEDRVFFGTDYPMWGAENELSFISRLNISDEIKEKLLWKNIAEFLQLDFE